MGISGATRFVDQEVEGAQAPSGLLEQSPHGRQVAEVGPDRPRLPARGLDGVDNLVGGGRARPS
jgi:hypothetical protein